MLSSYGGVLDQVRQKDPTKPNGNMLLKILGDVPHASGETSTQGGIMEVGMWMARPMKFEEQPGGEVHFHVNDLDGNRP